MYNPPWARLAIPLNPKTRLKPKADSIKITPLTDPYKNMLAIIVDVLHA
jgi:hypothetical protein